MSQQSQGSDGNVGKPVDDILESSGSSTGNQNDRLSRKLKAFWRRVGLDMDTFLRMMKGALAPVVVLAMYQSDAVSEITVTIGYIAVIITVTGQCLLPRAKFMKIMFFLVLSTCTAAAICCLAAFCAIKAREHTSAPGEVGGVYNSSASAVSAVWLFFSIWIANTLRATRPVELQDPMVAFSIFSAITLTHAARFTTVGEGLTFIRQLLLAFLFGLSIATGVSLMIIPITNRRNVFKSSLRYVDGIKEVLGAEKIFVLSVRRHGLLNKEQSEERSEFIAGPIDHVRNENSSEREEALRVVESASALRSSIAGLIALHDQMAGDLRYAKIEMAWGQLDSKDLGNIFALFRALLVPLAGLTLLPDVYEKRREWNQPAEGRVPSQAHWDRFLASLTEELGTTTDLVVKGLRHSLVVLGIASSKDNGRKLMPLPFQARKFRDIESSPMDLVPGDANFSRQLEQTLHKFYNRRQKKNALSSSSLHDEAKEIPEEDPTKFADVTKSASLETRFILLFVEHLIDRLLQSVLDFVKFAEGKVADGTTSRNRFIFPHIQFLSSALSFGPKHECGYETEGNDSSERARDPENLPPANAWERGSGSLRSLSRFLSSDQSTFGFRAAAASLTVAVLAYLHQTQDFFYEERVIWVLIVINIGMSPTSGASLFSFAGRVFGTAASLALSLVVWYIVVGHTAGVLVFLFLANTFEYYFYIKFPRFFGACVISIVTLNVIVGYSLQVNKLGVVLSESTGQPYHPIYLFGSYKLICVIVGCAIALFWTAFPYPVTSASLVRTLVGRGLFVLANFHSCVHSTIQVWMNEQKEEAEMSLGRLAVVKDKLFADEMSLLTAIRAQNRFTTYEPPIGGKFPRAIYDRISSGMQTILMSMALMAQTTRGLHGMSLKEDDKWLRCIGRASKDTRFNPHVTTALLCHLSAAVSNGLALTPYLSPPLSFALAREIRNLNAELLDINNRTDPAFSGFAVLEVTSALMSYKLSKLISDVRLLVGEVSFEGSVSKSVRQPRDKSSTGAKVD